MKNRLHRPGAQRAIASLFLVLVLAGVVAGAVRTFRAANATRQLARPAPTATPPRHGTAPSAGNHR